MLSFQEAYNKKEVLDIIELLNMDGFIHKKVKNYSLGMKQRLGLAQALLNDPQLLILDEPTNGLDPEGVVEIRNIIKTVVEKLQISVLISSHILSEIEIICDRVAFLQNGRLLEILDLKDSSITEICSYKMESTDTYKLKQILLQLHVSIKDTTTNAIHFESKAHDMEELIIQVVKMGGRISTVYPVEKNLEAKFFDLLGGNKIG